MCRILSKQVKFRQLVTTNYSWNQGFKPQLNSHGSIKYPVLCGPLMFIMHRPEKLIINLHEQSNY